MEALLGSIITFFTIMGIIATILLVAGFLLKSRGVTFVEFFPKKGEVAPAQVIYNNHISQMLNQSSYIEPRKVAAIMAAIKHHSKLKV